MFYKNEIITMDNYNNSNDFLTSYFKTFFIILGTLQIGLFLGLLLTNCAIKYYNNTYQYDKSDNSESDNSESEEEPYDKKYPINKKLETNKTPNEFNYIMENTPDGLVIMRYNFNNDGFDYWSNKNIKFVYLETVARKYVSRFHCAHLYIDRYCNKISVHDECVDDECVDDENVDDENVDDENVDDECVDDENVDDKSVDDECVDDECVDDENVDDECVDDENVDDECVDDENVDDENVDDECVDDECIDDECVDDECVDDECVDDKSVDDESVDDEKVSPFATFKNYNKNTTINKNVKKNNFQITSCKFIKIGKIIDFNFIKNIEKINNTQEIKMKLDFETFKKMLIK
jgi:hypothetical protein